MYYADKIYFNLHEKYNSIRMQSGVCNLSMIPVRKEPSHRSEMVSQLLFGDLYLIPEVNNDWAEICMEYDGYKGFISTGQMVCISNDDYEMLMNYRLNTITDIVQVIYNKTKNITQGIFIGSSIPDVRDEIFTLAVDVYLFR